MEEGKDGTEIQAFLHLFINSNILAAGLPSLLSHIDFWKKSIPVLFLSRNILKISFLSHLATR